MKTHRALKSRFARLISSLFFAISLLHWIAPVQAQSIYKVLYVVDGDTIDVEASTGPLRIRLSGIDAPESCNESSANACKERPSQPNGQLAKRTLRSLLENKAVLLKCESNLDRYGRNLCFAQLNGNDVGAMLLQAGLAWVYKSKVTPSSYYELETTARLKKVGLWADSNPIRPSDWRKQCWQLRQC